MSEYLQSARIVGVSKKLNDTVTMLRFALKNEHSALPATVISNANILDKAYGGGGLPYVVILAASLKALRDKNPQVAPVGESAWDSAQAREIAFRNRPAVSTLELLGGLGLAEVRNVNPGYVDGYEVTFDSTGFEMFTGINNLAALHAHDLMHFASQENG